MSVREYIGARYVPIFANPLDWDSTQTYEPLTIVYYQGNSFTSRQYVPAGIDINNDTYWAQTGNYNAQIEQYRDEVATFNGRITANAAAISAETNAREAAISAETNAREAAISAETNAREAAITELQGDIAQEVVDRTNAIESIQNEINKIRQIEKNVIVIGDSWSNSTTGTWLKYFISNYGYNVIKTYAMGGAGFIRPSATTASTFPIQVNEAISDSSYNHNEIGKIIIMGGVNDYNDGYTDASQFVTAIKSMLNNLKNEFINAEIYLFIGNLHFLPSDKRIYTESNTNMQQFWLWLRTKNLLARNGIKSQVMYPWLTGQYYQTDMLHPNDLGQNIIAANVEATIKGDNLYYAPVSVTTTNNVTTVKTRQQFINDSTLICTYAIYITTETTTSYQSTVSDGSFSNMFVYGANNTSVALFFTSYPADGPMGVYSEKNRTAVFSNGNTVGSDQANKTYTASEEILIDIFLN